MQRKIINQLIKQETQLLDRVESLDVLSDLIDDEFVEIGSSALIYDKAEVVRWMTSGDQSVRTDAAFKARQLSKDIILLTYISSIQSLPASENKQAMRSSIWRLRNERWRMIFHQGTPLK